MLIYYHGIGEKVLTLLSACSLSFTSFLSFFFLQTAVSSCGSLPYFTMLWVVTLGNKKLNERQLKFVDEYLIDMNATQAALRAGYSAKTAWSTGFHQMKNPVVLEAIKRKQEVIQRRTAITQDMVIKELAAVAFSSGADYATVSNRGAVKLTPTEKLSPEQRAAVASVKKGKYATEVKTHDKIKALELLGKHLGMFSGAGAPEDADEKLAALLQGLKDAANNKQ